MRTSEEIDAIILERYGAGRKAYQIADRLGMPVVDVRSRMRTLGLHDERGSHDNLYHVHPNWNAEPDARRMWIWKRQHDGAVATQRGRV